MTVRHYFISVYIIRMLHCRALKRNHSVNTDEHRTPSNSCNFCTLFKEHQLDKFGILSIRNIQHPLDWNRKVSCNLLVYCFISSLVNKFIRLCKLCHRLSSSTTSTNTNLTNNSKNSQFSKQRQTIKMEEKKRNNSSSNKSIAHLPCLYE